ncbi:WD_REPEATS_REGION domain-containing protein, partial [Psidium guajava]
MQHNKMTLNHQCVTSFKTLTPHLSCLAANRNLLYAAAFNQVHVFDLSTRAHVDSFSAANPSSGSVKSIAFSGSKVFTAHQDRKIRVWQIMSRPSRQHCLLSSLPTLKDRLMRFILPKNYVRVRRHKKQLWIEHGDAVSSLAVKEGLMYSVSWDKSLKVWDARENKCLESVNEAHDDAVNAVVVSDDGTVYTASADGAIRVWEKKEKERRHRLMHVLERHKSSVNALALNHTGDDGLFLFSGGSDHSIGVWRRDDGRDRMATQEVLWGHGGAILCLTVVGNGVLLSGSSDQTVRVWRPGEAGGGYCCVGTMGKHERPVKSVVRVSTSADASDDNENDAITVCSG